MRFDFRDKSRSALSILALAGLLAFPAAVRAHCDTLDGPVVAAARAALAAGDVTPVLKWLQPDDEAAIRDVFRRTLAARGQGDAARELADQYFFETLVRLHRAGEGFPFTGLAPAGAPIAPAIRAADAALASGRPDELVGELSSAVSSGVRERFAKAREARAHADESVEAGRHYVAAYVELTHYVEALEAIAAGHVGEHGDPAKAAGHPHD
jgi:hypothetical protein